MKQQGAEESMREQAAAWVIRLQAEPSTLDLQRFEQWRNQSREHAAAYDAAMAAWSQVGEFATAPQVLAMRRDALERARRTARGWDRRTLVALVSFLILAPVIALTWLHLRAPQVQTFQTAHGEQRVIVLADGSRLSMDALTEVDVTYTNDVRNIALATGRASFDVARDVTRPMNVRVGSRIVTALGTVFTVEREPGQIVVTLVEGKVAVSSPDTMAKPIEMSPLQQLQMTDEGKVSLREGIDPIQALAWREGKLVFDDEPLTAAVARMNNYGAIPMLVVGPARELRISGVFRAGDTAAFVEAMETYFPLVTTWQANAITLRLAESASNID
jgi:transmembrane sensor